MQRQKNHIANDNKRKFDGVFSDETAITDTKKKVKENNCIPNLQLSLRPMISGNGDGKGKDTETGEADSMLSLSLSPPVCKNQVKPFTEHNASAEREMEFFQTLAAAGTLWG